MLGMTVPRSTPNLGQDGMDCQKEQNGSFPKEKKEQQEMKQQGQSLNVLAGTPPRHIKATVHRKYTVIPSVLAADGDHDGRKMSQKRNSEKLVHLGPHPKSFNHEK